METTKPPDISKLVVVETLEVEDGEAIESGRKSKCKKHRGWMLFILLMLILILFAILCIYIQ